MYIMHFLFIIVFFINMQKIKEILIDITIEICSV